MIKKRIPNKDAVVKTAMEVLFPDLLRFIFEQADEIFDFSEPIVFLDKELDKIEQRPNKGGGCVLDKLARVRLKNGGYEHVLVLLEAEGGGKSNFAERMFTHYYRVRDRHGGKICSIAILTDRNRKFRPSNYSEECLGTKLSFDFNTLKIWGQNRQELEINKNPFSIAALVVLAELERGKLSPDGLIELGKGIARNLLKRKISGTQRRAILAFLHNYIHFDNPEIQIKFETEINSITHNSNTMAIIGLREMVEEEYKDKFARLHQRNKTKNLRSAEKMLKDGLKPGTVSRYLEIPIYQVRKIAKQLTAKSEV